MTTTAVHALDLELLPDESLWGPGFGSAPYPAETLAEIAGYIAETRQPGYGARLHTTSAGYVPGGDRAQVPPGYDATGHPNRAGGSAESMDPEITTSLDVDPVQIDARVQEYSRTRGWLLDQHGRPLHPHHAQLLDDDRIGLPVGLGFCWWAGEQAVSDAVVTSAGSVLLVPRHTDQGTISSLPGGYSIPGDEGRTSAEWRAGDRTVTQPGILTTAVRKVREETGLEVPRDARMRIVRAIRPVSSPHTLNAWTCTYTVHVDLGMSRPTLPDSAEGTGRSWVDVEDLHSDVLARMWPDHRRALLAAIE